MERTENTPRRRTSTAICDRVSIDSERLSPGAGGSVLPSTDGLRLEDSKEKPPSHRSVSKVILSVIVVFVTSVLVLIKVAAWRRQPEPLTGSGELGTDDQFLAIQLHPKDHIYREPKILRYDWVVSSGVRAPDGVRKSVYLINGKLPEKDGFPGPTIEARTGDTLIISVTNSLKEGVSMHWHGLHMREANEMDGAVGFTQSPIAPGESFIYQFTINDQDGTFWYHAHSHVQRGDGLYGGLIVHKPAKREDDTRSIPNLDNEVMLLVGDWFHRSSDTILEWYTSVRGFGNEPVPDSLVINGVGFFDCSMAVPARPVECSPVRQAAPIFHDSKPVRLRVVNVGTIAGVSIKISNARLTPLQIDGGFDITPTPSYSVGILYPGERVDIAVHWNDNVEKVNSNLEVKLDPENFKYPNPALTPYQSFPAISHKSPDPPTSILDASAEGTEFDLQTAQGLPTLAGISIPSIADQTVILYIKTLKLSKYANHPMGFINRTSWSPQDPPLIDLPRSAWDTNQLVPYILLDKKAGDQGRWVDMIVNNLDDGSHPFHLHGHDFYVLESSKSENGWGSFKGTTFPPLVRPEGLLRKDTVMVPRRGYVVLRFRADNEGIWMFHCHLLVHLGSGMAMGFQVSEQES